MLRLSSRSIRSGHDPAVTPDRVRGMIDAEYATPDVPTEIGEEHAVFFTRRGQEYRIVLDEPDVWVIHRRDTDPKSFEIVLENPDRNRRVFDATGRAGLTFTAAGHTLSFVITQFC